MYGDKKNSFASGCLSYLAMTFIGIFGGIAIVILITGMLGLMNAR